MSLPKAGQGAPLGALAPRRVAGHTHVLRGGAAAVRSNGSWASGGWHSGACALELGRGRQVLARLDKSVTTPFIPRSRTRLAWRVA